MIENLTFWERTRIWLSDWQFMQTPLAWIDRAIDRFQQIQALLMEILAEVWFYVRYVCWLFAVIVLLIALQIILKYLLSLVFNISDNERLPFWNQYTPKSNKKIFQGHKYF